MAGNDVFLYSVPAYGNPADVRLTDPNNVAGGSVSFSVAVTEGADTLAANVSPVIALTGAATEGADVLAAAVSPVVSALSATTDGADVLAAAVSVVSTTIDFSSATSDGADVLAGTVSPVSALTSSTTDGVDVLSAAVGPIVGLSSSTTDGADLLAAAVSVAGVVSLSASWTDGADLLSAAVSPVVAPVVTKSGGDDAPRRGRYQVQVRNKLHLFDTDQEAIAFLSSLSRKAKKVATKKALEPAYVQMMSAITAEFDDEQDIEELLMLL